MLENQSPILNQLCTGQVRIGVALVFKIVTTDKQSYQPLASSHTEME